MDECYGKGRWCPLPRHVVNQDDKDRPIDDGSRAGHNDAAHMLETIVCQTPEVVPLSMKFLVMCMLRKYGILPPWSKLAFGTEDMWKGFRQMGPTNNDKRFCIITFVHPHTKKRVYVQLEGCPSA